MIKHYRIIVRGKVQGVWFRKYTMQEAQLLRLNGFVKNQSDGSVYIEAEGDQQTLESLVKWCWKGSPLSEVETVDWQELVVQNHIGFTIER